MADDDTSPPKNNNNNQNKDESKQEDESSSSNGAVNDDDSLQAVDMREADESLSSVENNNDNDNSVGIQLGFAETASLQGLTLSLLRDVTCPLYRAIQQVKEQQQQQQSASSSSHLPNPSAHQANVRAEQFHDKMDDLVSDLGTAVQQEAWRQATRSDRHVWMARLFWPRHDDDNNAAQDE